MSSDTATTLNFEVEVGWEQLPEGMTLHETPGVAVGPDDSVYLLTRNTANPVIVLTSKGEFIRTFGAGVFTPRTHAIYVAADGSIFCADDGAHAITKWSSEGDLLLTIGAPGDPAPRFSGEPFNRPTDMVVLADGSVIISDGYGNARIHKYSPDGEHLMSWGEPGIDPGQFMVPHNLGLDGERLLGGQSQQGDAVGIAIVGAEDVLCSNPDGLPVKGVGGGVCLVEKGVNSSLDAFARHNVRDDNRPSPDTALRRLNGLERYHPCGWRCLQERGEGSPDMLLAICHTTRDRGLARGPTERPAMPVGVRRRTIRLSGKSIRTEADNRRAIRICAPRLPASG